MTGKGRTVQIFALSAAIAALAASSPAHADFRLDMSGKEIREALQRRAIEDLEVGETAGVRLLNTCSQDGGLYLYTMVGLSENVPGEPTQYRVTRQPDRRVSVEVVSAEGGADAVRQMIVGAVGGAHLRGCKIAGMSEDQLFRVTTINGLTNDREIFGWPQQ